MRSNAKKCNMWLKKSDREGCDVDYTNRGLKERKGMPCSLFPMLLVRLCLTIGFSINQILPKIKTK